jgi:uncharacterized membrane protein YhaH (DUF805 family)
MRWYFRVLRKYAVFAGRASRKEFWVFKMVSFMAALILMIIDIQLGTVDPTSHLGLISTLYILGACIPGIAVTVRRLHDTNRSGWYYLMLLIPLLGYVALLFCVCEDSQPGANRYGPNPKLQRRSLVPAGELPSFPIES